MKSILVGLIIAFTCSIANCAPSKQKPLTREQRAEAEGYIEEIDRELKLMHDHPADYDLAVKLSQSLSKLSQQSTVTIAVIVKEETNDDVQHPFLVVQQQNLMESLLMAQDHPNVSIIERKRLDAIIDEAKLSYTGLTAKDSAELGKLLNVTHIAFTDLLVIAEDGMLHTKTYLKMVDVKTGRIEFAQKLPDWGLK